MTPDGPPESGGMQWAVAAGCLLALTCVLAWLATIHPVYVGYEGPDAPQAPRPDMRLDLNTASAADLQALPRLGPALAQRIVDDRDANGPFASLEDLSRVSGIGDRTIQMIAPHVVVAAPGEPPRP